MTRKEYLQDNMNLYEFGVYLDGFSLREVPRTRHDYSVIIRQMDGYPISAVCGTGQPCMLFYCFDFDKEKARKRMLSLLIGSLEDSIKYRKIQRIIKDL